MMIRAYLRASTKKQDALRAREGLKVFAKERNHQVAAFYSENISGVVKNRPELMRLLDDSEPGDVLLVEQIDRLTRLTDSDWQALKTAIAEKGVSIVSLDLPTSHIVLSESGENDFTRNMMKAVNAMLVDMMAAISRKDYEDRRRRQAQGIEKARGENKYKGRPASGEKQKAVQELRAIGKSVADIQKITGYSRSQVFRVIAEAKKKQQDREQPELGLI